MKTSIKTLIAISLTAMVMSTSVATASVSTSGVASVNSPKTNNFRRITVKGNVELTIIQGSTTSIAYADDNYGSAKVMQEGDNLKISSSGKDVTKMIVYVKELYRIQASENATVKTEGKLDTQFLQVFLKGSAKADINSNTEGLYTVIEDNAYLTLSGSTDDHTLVMGKTQKLTIDKFAALKTTISSIETAAIETKMAANK
ncbi:GIN domain-containing protein [Pedobacter endophyticus]|uniref:DUF2807 domain-containing protein n=1 Tax=Pedobacter endophyticus TaxID=2789740 RepID=A0A7S9KZJ1_9SPHI|nr:DUF2807 domain-containing protein [Pedobacter endophyticus]QPH39729.1 DUF2807 domain-containing protein [Pedobacter endophyticus]